MVDTARTRADLLTALFQDGQTNGISAQDMRDLILSLYRTGWGDYVDNTYNTGAPFEVAADTATVVPNDAAGANRVQEVPPDYASGFYSGGKILGNAGDGLLLTVEYKIRRAAGNGTFLLENWLDIGGGINDLYHRNMSLPGQGDQNVTWTTAVYTLDTWEANGADLYIRTSVATEIYDIRFVIYRLHAGQGSYGE